MIPLLWQMLHCVPVKYPLIGCSTWAWRCWCWQLKLIANTSSPSIIRLNAAAGITSTNCNIICVSRYKIWPLSLSTGECQPLHSSLYQMLHTYRFTQLWYFALNCIQDTTTHKTARVIVAAQWLENTFGWDMGQLVLFYIKAITHPYFFKKDYPSRFTGNTKCILGARLKHRFQSSTHLMLMKGKVVDPCRERASAVIDQLYW